MTHEEAVAFLETLEADENIKDATSVLDALKNTRAEAKTNREKAEALEAELAGVKTFKEKSKSTAINRELKAQGIKNPDRIIKLLKVDEIELDDNGAIKNLDAQVELARTDYPELFEAKRHVGSVDQFSGEEPKKQLSATERQVLALSKNR